MGEDEECAAMRVTERKRCIVRNSSLYNDMMEVSRKLLSRVYL